MQRIQQENVPDDRSLPVSVKKGDSRAFEALYKRYAPYLISYSEMIVKDRDAAYEVVQDTFVSVWINRRKLDESRSIRNYLLRAVHNNSLCFLRKEAARHSREQIVASEGPVSIPPSEQEEPSYGIEELIPAIERLPEQSRKVFCMTFWEDMKSLDIAHELSISVRTVESILYKVRKKLRSSFRKG